MLCIGFNRSQMFCKDLVISAISVVTINPGNAKVFEIFPVGIFWYKFFHVSVFFNNII